MPIVIANPKPASFGANEVGVVYDAGATVGIRRIDTTTGGSFASLISDTPAWYSADFSSDATYFPSNDSVVFLDGTGTETIFEVGLDGVLVNSYSAEVSLQEFSSVAWDTSGNRFVASHKIGGGATGQWYESFSVSGLSVHGSPVHLADLFGNPVTNTVNGMAYDSTNGTMWIVEALTFTVSEVNLSTGFVVSSFTATGDWSGNFPKGILIKNNEIIVVSSFGPSKIAKYTKAGAVIEAPADVPLADFSGDLGLIG